MPSVPQSRNPFLTGQAPGQGGAADAANVSYTPQAPITGNNVQDALDQLALLTSGLPIFEQPAHPTIAQLQDNQTGIWVENVGQKRIYLVHNNNISGTSLIYGVQLGIFEGQ